MIHIDCPTCHSTNRIPIARLLDGPRCGRCKAVLPRVNAPVTVESAADFRDWVSDSPIPVLVDFWAPWCGPCRRVAPELEKLAKAQESKTVVLKVNTDVLPELGSEYGVRSIPTLLLFRGGRESKRVSGAMPAPAIAQAFGL